MSVCIGASAAGARAYTATASQGLLYMAEALYNASGLGLPIVMTVANRAIGAPINIWNDHSDSMSQRDSGWIQLYAEDNQEAVDLHVQAFKLAERLSLPVMVCMDGFILTHAYERVDVPSQEQVDAFLPAFEPRQVLDPADPVTIGAMVGPGGLHRGQVPGPREADAGARPHPRGRGRVRGGVRARLRRPACAATAPRTPRRSSSRSARCSGRSRTRSTSCARRGSAIGALGDQVLPPLPAGGGARGAGRRASGSSCSRRRSRSAIGGIVSANVRLALSGIELHGYTVIAGLGGRPITKTSLRGLFADAVADRLEPLSFLDLDWDRVEAELQRMRGGRPDRAARREHPARRSASSRRGRTERDDRASWKSPLPATSR